MSFADTDSVRQGKLMFTLPSTEDAEERIVGYQTERDSLLIKLADAQRSAQSQDESACQLRSDLKESYDMLQNERQLAIAEQSQHARFSQQIILEFANLVINSRRMRSTIDILSERIPEAKQRLARSNETISELTSTVSSLREGLESREAERDLLDDRCKSLSTELSSRKEIAAGHASAYDKQAIELQEANEIASALRKERDQVQEDLAKVNKQLKDLTADLSEKESELSNHRSTSDAVTQDQAASLSRLEDSIVDLRLCADEAMANAERHRNAREQAESSVQYLTAQLDAQQKAVDDLRQMIEKSDKVRSDLTQQVHQLQEEVLAAKQKARRLDAEKAESLAAAETAATRISELASQVETATAEAQLCRKELQEAEASSGDLQSHLREVEEILAVTERSSAASDTQKKGLLREKDELESQLVRVRVQLERAHSEAQELAELLRLRRVVCLLWSDDGFDTCT